MAKGLMSCLKKRDLIQDLNTSPEVLIRSGQEFLNQGRTLESLEFFERAQDPEGLRLLKEKGVEEGDPFLYRQTCKSLKESPDPAAWKRIGEIRPIPGPVAPGLNRL